MGGVSKLISIDCINRSIAKFHLDNVHTVLDNLTFMATYGGHILPNLDHTLNVKHRPLSILNMCVCDRVSLIYSAIMRLE